MARKVLFILVLGAGLLLIAACGPGATPTPMIIRETVEVPAESAAMAVEVPFLEQWMESPHNDVTAEAFIHWNEDDPAEVPPECARCHSTPGYQDWVGADGTAAGVTDNASPIGTTVQCVACHNDVTLTMTSVVMPSGIELTGLGDESRCMQCHQGRASKFTVDSAIEEAGVDADSVSEDLGFINIHYFAAAATKYGTEAKGGYEYDGSSYDAFFVHVEGYQACTDCHNPHSLELKFGECSTCHPGVASVEDLHNLRMPGSQVDYDGDGDIEEGIYFEIQGMQEKLYSAMQAYAAEVAGAAVVYDSATYPYFFNDSNSDGEVSPDEAAFANQFAAWTPRLVKAAYNYQVSLKDPGNYAHGGKYIIQLLWDSIADLNEAIASPIQLADTNGHSNRTDMGHFAGSEEAFRHWDGDDPAEVPASCSRCHSAEGLPLYLSQGVTIAQPPANGFKCTTCHSSVPEYSRYEVASVTFPSGAEIDSGNPDMNLCMTCHQGRSSTTTVNNAVAGLPPDTAAEDLGFINIHYFAAGATIFGSDVEGGYQFDGKTYVGRFEHVQSFNGCTSCHSAHQLQVKYQACSGCHTNVQTYEDLHSIRISTVDYDGDGDASEGLAMEVETMNDALYAAMQAYASDRLATSIVYNAARYPYFFTEEGESFTGWSPNLLKAAYNFQYASKDPGAFAHNGKYVIQLLYDSIEAVGGSTSGMTRP